MQIIDLFSGIGGFSYAGQKIPNWRTVTFCEMDLFCCDVLRKNFGYKIPIHDNVKTLTKELLIRYGWNEKETTIITGGFPCQPFSNAGFKGGEDDNRYLWPAMFRIIREVKPRFIIGENVPGIVDMVLPDIRTDLESEGYRVEMFIIPACSVGGLHRRDRVWIITYSDSNRLQGWLNEERYKISNELSSILSTFPLCKNKVELPEPKVVGGDDGIPNRMDRIKALGNAIVPEVAFIIMYVLDKLNNYYEK